MIELQISRYHPDKDAKPYLQNFAFSDNEIPPGMMLLTLLKKAQERDPSLGFRSSCQEGVCGSDGMNVNGQNRLSCITPVKELGRKIVIRPLPGFPIIKDLIVDMEIFYQQYHAVDPFLKAEPATDPDNQKENLQTPQERKQLDGSYECILCACCSSSCPSFWWNPDLFPGPAALLASHRFVIDSRDITTIDRLNNLDDAGKVFRCRHIQNCTASCPKGLNPSRAIQSLKKMVSASGKV